MRKRRVLVIGLDGGSWNVLNPLIKEGKMPNLARLIKEGVSGILQSTIPPLSAIAWTSFMTGKNPGKHSIYDFLRWTPGSMSRRVINARDIAGQTLWSILTEEKKIIGVINVPVTYPPSPVNGFMISGMLTPRAEELCFPKGLYEELKEKIGDYNIVVNPRFYGNTKQEIRRFLQDSILCNQQRTKATCYLMKKYDWDFLMTTFTEIDRVQHILWDYITQISFQDEKKEKIKELIGHFYQKVDEDIGRICTFIDDETTVFVVSDHGFGPLEGKFYINKWLEKEGLLKTDWKKLHLYKLFISLLKYTYNFLEFIDFLGLRRKTLWKFLKSKLMKRGKSFSQMPYNCFDWSKTKAYSPSNTEQGIHINLKGREPEGTVSGEDYEKIRNLIIQKLEELKDRETGEKLPVKIYKREEIYHGPYLNNAPDLVFSIKDGAYVSRALLTTKIFKKASRADGIIGSHRLEGIFITKGKGIKRGVKSPAQIIDILPTILFQMRISIPDNLDGQVLGKIFQDKFLQRNPIRYKKVTERKTKKEKAEKVLSLEEDRIIEERLKGLGYL